MTIEPTTVKLALGAALTWIASVSVYAMTFTASDLTAIAAALAILIGAFFTGVIGIITARAAAKVTAKKLDEVAEKANVLIGKTDVIGGHVNSATTALTADNRDLRGQIEKLTQALTESRTREAEGKTVARELATTTAVIAAAHAVGAASAGVGATGAATPAAKQDEQVERMQQVTDKTHELVTGLKGVDVPAVAENVDTLVQSIKKETR